MQKDRIRTSLKSVLGLCELLAFLEKGLSVQCPRVGQSELDRVPYPTSVTI
jgi:hypothetical protein